MPKNRENEILKKLIKSDSPLVIKELARQLEVSPRTIRYDLDKIESWLNENGLKLQRKQGVGIYLKDSAEDKLTNILDMELDYKRAYTPEERQQLILKELLERDEPVIIKEFEINLDVSEGTIINDLNKVENWLQHRNLELLRKPNYGIEIRGYEDNWRRAVFDFLEESSSREDTSSILNLFKKKNNISSFISSYQELLNLINSSQVKTIKDIIRRIEKKLDFSFTDAAFSALVLHIVIAVQRILKNKDINMNSRQLLLLKKKKEFEIAGKIVAQLEDKFELEIPESEIGYITLHLLGAKFRRKGEVDFDNNKLFDDRLLNLTYQLVEIAGRILNLNLTNDQDLIYGLALHLKPTLNRIKYNLNIENQLVNDIKDKYPEIYRASKIAAGVVQTEIQGEISEEEIGFIAMHIGAAVERKNIKPAAAQKLKAALVCSTGIGTTQILAERIKNEFSNLEIVDSYSYHDIEYNDFKLNEIDFIISTIELPEIELKNVQVNPLLKEEDIENIEELIIELYNQKIYQNNSTAKDSSSQNKKPANLKEMAAELVESASDNFQLKDKKEFRNKLEKLFKKHLKPKEDEEKEIDESSDLESILKPSLLKTEVEAADWKQAVEKSGQLLLKQNYIDEIYIENMIKNIEKRGPYVVIIPGVALVHASPEEGVNNFGLSLITLREAVEFNHPENDPVQIVIAFASPDKNKDIKALSSLINKLYNKEFMDKIISLNNKQKIIELLTQKEDQNEKN
ncbi:BglG family transcriptional antiterminator [Halanaerobium saccharolyticum]|uniref:BglG family transcriptional antiterminator n=1 Tax=Halanaerobium saccharolyticum TaxID=43595 RepID=A0A2T5RGP7_9FIRM|nr:BglG family transcription antiterminator [Halanaerobium saccharolyticum]PTV94084.1 BglG family transcriptional antiterminator [Halanaerobium saccharolyticum]